MRPLYELKSTLRTKGTVSTIRKNSSSYSKRNSGGTVQMTFMEKLETVLITSIIAAFIAGVLLGTAVLIMFGGRQ